MAAPWQPRVHPRYPIVLPAVCQATGHDLRRPAAMGQVLNLSLGGACVSLQEVFLPGTRVRLTSEFARTSIPFAAEVMWVGPPSATGLQPHGVAFLDLAPDQWDALRKVTDCKGGQPPPAPNPPVAPGVADLGRPVCYRVICDGYVKPGHAVEAVKTRMATLTQLEAARLDLLFRGGMDRVILKRGLDRASAEQWAAAIDQTGAGCRIEAEPAENPWGIDPKRLAAKWLRAERVPRRRRALRRYAVRLALALAILFGVLWSTGLLSSTGSSPRVSTPVRR